MLTRSYNLILCVLHFRTSATKLSTALEQQRRKDLYQGSGCDRQAAALKETSI